MGINIMGTCNDSAFYYLCFTNLMAFVLFLASEFLASSRFESNGVLQFLSRRIKFLGGRRIRIDFSIPPASIEQSLNGTSVTEESPLLEEEEEEEEDKKEEIEEIEILGL